MFEDIIASINVHAIDGETNTLIGSYVFQIDKYGVVHSNHEFYVHYLKNESVDPYSICFDSRDKNINVANINLAFSVLQTDINVGYDILDKILSHNVVSRYLHIVDDTANPIKQNNWTAELLIPSRKRIYNIVSDYDFVSITCLIKVIG